MYKIDYHIHSLNSPDGFNSIDEICEGAVHNGVYEIAITDHYEPPFYCLSDQDYKIIDSAISRDSKYLQVNLKKPHYKVEQYFQDVEAARDKYGNKLKIKAGVELGNADRHFEFHENLLKWEYDYVLSSVHAIDDKLEFGNVIYTRENCEKYIALYLEHIQNMIKWGNFNCVGHITYPFRYIAHINGAEEILRKYYPSFREILKLLIYNGKGIEINTSGMRTKYKYIMPNIDVLNIYRELGGEIITIGTDSHKRETIGWYFNNTIDTIRDCGFKYIATFENRKVDFIKII